MVAVLVRLLNWTDRRAGCCAHLGNETGHARAHAGATPAGLAGAASLGRRACGAGHAVGAGLVAGVIAAVSAGAGVPAAEPAHPPWAVPGQAAHGAAKCHPPQAAGGWYARYRMGPRWGSGTTPAGMPVRSDGCTCSRRAS